MFLGIGLSLCQPRRGGTPTPTPTPGISAPVISQTSGAGTNPFTWSVAENPDFQVGDFWHVQRATGTDATAAQVNLLAGTLNGEAIQRIEHGDLVDNYTIVFTDLTPTPTGPLALRLRVERDDGIGGTTLGAWSNVLTDTIAATSVAALTASDGTSKSQYINTTGTPKLTATMNNDLGAPCNVKATVAASGKRHWEVTLNSNSNQANNFSIGITDLAFTVGPGLIFPRPGNGTDPGVSINLPRGSSNVNLYVNGGYVGDYALISAFAPGDLIIIEQDDAAKTVSFWHSRSGTHQLLVTTTLTSNIPTNWTAVVAGYGNSGGTPDSMTCNFGASAFAKTPSSGYSFYG